MSFITGDYRYGVIIYWATIHIGIYGGGGEDYNQEVISIGYYTGQGVLSSGGTPQEIARGGCM